MAYWLMKTEPDECSIDDFANAPNKALRWDGVRNYQARNFMRAMATGDQVFLYHSSCAEIGIVGIVEVVKATYPDPAQYDPESAYFDPKSSPEKPRWDAVDVRFVSKFNRVLGLAELRTISALAEQPLLRKGNRLSVIPFSTTEWRAVVATLSSSDSDNGRK
ncbi:EVE domain-containing protein [Pseudidiomarina mangrovi]|uniref:EVE domain-containing protein n=1 Tax=Pseudidiomarina mangrovi TaxID=2487133 RepID=UPI000FCBDC2F|nr:EVE domain-containing protein [Pseudidiomarina mangrovi]